MSEPAPATEAEAEDASEPKKPSFRDRRDEGRATVSLVLGIAALFLAWVPIISIGLGLVAIGFGATRVNSRSRMVAIFGIALGVVAVGLNIAATIFVLG